MCLSIFTDRIDGRRELCFSMLILNPPYVSSIQIEVAFCPRTSAPTALRSSSLHCVDDSTICPHTHHSPRGKRRWVNYVLQFSRHEMIGHRSTPAPRQAKVVDVYVTYTYYKNIGVQYLELSHVLAKQPACLPSTSEGHSPGDLRRHVRVAVAVPTHPTRKPEYHDGLNRRR